MLVAIVLALCVPFAQLRAEPDRTECCCPDPDRCKCPDHEPPSNHTTMRACHKQAPDAVASQLSVFVAPVAPRLVAPVAAEQAPRTQIPAPHPPPAPRRPDAPS